MELEFFDYFKGVIDSSASPIVICNLDYRIIYANPTAVRTYACSKIDCLKGASLRLYFNEEDLSKLDMTIEWFKEAPCNNKVFAFHDDAENKDVYIRAIRDEQGGLIGFFNYHEFREPEKGKQFDMD